MAYDVMFLRGTKEAYDALQTKDNKTFYYVTDANGDAFYIGSHALNNDLLNVNGFALGSISNGDIITLNGIKEEDGKIVADNTSANQIVFAKVAKTGAAEDVSYSATIGETAVTNVDDALDAIVDAMGDGVASKTIYMTDNTSTSGTDYAQIYKIYQGSNGNASAPDANELVGTINIPKDQFVESSDLVDITFNSLDGKLYDGVVDVTSLIKGAEAATAADAGKYVKIVFAITSGSLAKSTIYINVKSLVDVYRSGSQSTDEIVITIDPATNEITAAPGTNGIQAAHISIEDTGDIITATNVEGALAEIATEIDGMDAVVDATKTAIDGSTARVLDNSDAVAVLQAVTEADGKITNMTVVEAAQVGAAGSGRSGSGTELDPYVYADTIKGAKAYTTDKVAEIQSQVDDLDVSDFALTSVSGSILTISGIKEVDGKIAKSTDTSKDVTLAKAAMTGKAEDVALNSATAQKFSSATNTDAALSELANVLTWQSI